MICRLLSSTEIDVEALPARENSIRGDTLLALHGSEVFRAGL